MKLTDKTVESAQCPEGAKDKLFFDETLPGFGLRVTASGTRIFIFQYSLSRTKRRMVLGALGEITTAQARRKAEALRGQVRDRRDPDRAKDSARPRPWPPRPRPRPPPPAAPTRSRSWFRSGRNTTWPPAPGPIASGRPPSFAAPSNLAARAGRPLRPRRCRAGVGRVKVLYGPVSANRLRSEARAFGPGQSSAGRWP